MPKYLCENCKIKFEASRYRRFCSHNCYLESVAKRKMLVVDLWNQIFNDKEIKKLYDEALKKCREKGIYVHKFRKEIKKGLHCGTFTVITEKTNLRMEEILKKNPKAFIDKEWMLKYNKWREFFKCLIEQIVMELS